MEHVLTCGEESKYQEISLITPQTQIPARRLYAKYGFETRLKYQKKLFGGLCFLDELFLTKKLAKTENDILKTEHHNQLGPR